jgi:hypothetical protein
LQKKTVALADVNGKSLKQGLRLGQCFCCDPSTTWAAGANNSMILKFTTGGKFFKWLDTRLWQRATAAPGRIGDRA